MKSTGIGVFVAVCEAGMQISHDHGLVKRHVAKTHMIFIVLDGERHNR